MEINRFIVRCLCLSSVRRFCCGGRRKRDGETSVL